MNLRNLLSTLLLTLLLIGCSHQGDLKTGDSSSRIDRLIEKQHYSSALRAIKHLSSDDPAAHSAARYRKQVEQLIRKYVKTTIIEADKLEKANQWGDAKKAYQTTLNRIPDNPQLEKRYNAFELRHQKRLAILELNLLVARGTWLSQYLSLYSEYKMADPAFWATLSGPNKNEMQTVAGKLLTVGKKAMAEGAIQDAERTLPLATKLNPELGKDPVHAELNKRLKKQRLAARRLIEQKRKKEATRLRTEFAVAIESGDLIGAKEQLTKLKPYLPKAEAERISDTFQKEVDSAVSTYLAEGNRLYSEGKFRAAMERWQLVLALDPDNKVATSAIERAQRVINKLKRLKQKKGLQNSGE